MCYIYPYVFRHNRVIIRQSATNALPSYIRSSNCNYLGLHFDRKLTCKEHIITKRKQLDHKTREIKWLIGKNSPLSLENKLLIYKTILKPIWTYGIVLWGCASKSNIAIMQRYQSKILRLITNAP